MASPYIKISSGNLAAMHQSKTGYVVGLMAQIAQGIWNAAEYGATAESLYTKLWPHTLTLSQFERLLEAMRLAGAIKQNADGNWLLTSTGEKFLPKLF